MLFLIFPPWSISCTHLTDWVVRSKHFDKKRSVCEYADTLLDWEDLLGELRTEWGWEGVVVSRLLMRGKLIRELLQRERRKEGGGRDLLSNKQQRGRGRPCWRTLGDGLGIYSPHTLPCFSLDQQNPGGQGGRSCTGARQRAPAEKFGLGQKI